MSIATTPPATARQDPEETRRQLEALREEVAAIGKRQRERESERSAAEVRLRQSEKALGNLARDMAALRRDIAATERELSDLGEERTAVEDALAAQRDAVAEELRRAWRGGGEDPVKLLLNQDDPQAVARLLAYYRYILEARSEVVDEYRRNSETLAAVQAKQEAARDAQLAQQEALAQREEQLVAEKAEREANLAAIGRLIASDAARLAAAQEDVAELEKLLEEIEAALAAAPDAPEDFQPFSAARGTMAWPVDGRITHRFGQARNQGKMRWQGVRMRAEAGTTVRAIHHGRVVYADWLRGSGLLMVIDHGEGFMSLYAHNESLLREVGDWVSPGAPVATVGDSGGQSEAALYFEIRKDGKPTNPQNWCRG